MISRAVTAVAIITAKMTQMAIKIGIYFSEIRPDRRPLNDPTSVPLSNVAPGSRRSCCSNSLKVNVIRNREGRREVGSSGTRIAFLYELDGEIFSLSVLELKRRLQ